MWLNYIPGAVVSKRVPDGGYAKGATGFARYSDEAYKVCETPGGRNIRPETALPTCPTRFFLVRGGIN